MSDARVLEKVLRRSRRARYSGGARSDHEELRKELDIIDTSSAFCEFSGPEETERRFGILPLHEASGDRKQGRLLKKLEKSYRLLPAALMSLRTAP
jgi:hypothetical protein